MTFPTEMTPGQRRRLSIAGFLLVLAVAVVAAMFGVLVIKGNHGASAETVREYNLEIVPTDIDYGRPRRRCASTTWRSCRPTSTTAMATSGTPGRLRTSTPPPAQSRARCWKRTLARS